MAQIGKIVLLCLIYSCGINPLLSQENQTVRVEEDASLIFMLHIQKQLEKLSVEYNLKHNQYRQTMEEILEDARSINNLIKRIRNKKRVPKGVTEEQQLERARILSKKALEESRAYLKVLDKALEQKESELINSMIPKKQD